ncbi:MAG: folylpolyglutamate synthase/dihydrofolate synthase family protein [Candidatus Micrarchaeota archaeon]
MGVSYSEAMEQIYALGKRMPPRQYLKSMEKLLLKLGNPQNDFDSILVTGTNGKGSTVAMTASALKCSGLRTGRYLSPHIDRFSERICMDDKEIPKKRVAEVYETVKQAMESIGHVTFFEFVTSMAFQYFSEEGADCAVLEVGLGGRLDATNLAWSSLGAITSVELDHTGVLGKRLSSIAREKAGIIRHGGRVITGEGKREPLGIIRETCAKKDAELLAVGKDIRYETIRCTNGGNEYLVTGFEGTYRVSLSMLGAHQGANASIAVGLAEMMGASQNAIEKGVGEAILPCRLELVGRGPSVLMDCAHNPNAARALVAGLRLFQYNKLILVVGMMDDKDIDSFLKELGQIADVLIVNQPSVPRAAAMEKLFGLGKQYCARTVGARDVGCSVEMAKSLANRKDLICLAGSIYMLAEVRGKAPVIAQ